MQEERKKEGMKERKKGMNNIDTLPKVPTLLYTTLHYSTLLYTILNYTL